MSKKEQLAEHYRGLIRDGKLTPGDRLPPTRSIAYDHDVSEPTARAALAWLRAAGHIRTTQRGSFVAEHVGGSASAQDRLRRAIRTGSTDADTETQEVTAAELIVPPPYILGIYELEDGDQVLRREYVVRNPDNDVQELHVDWYPATFAAQVAPLLSKAPRTSGELLAAVEQAVGRTVNHGRDALRARAADEREARLMEIEVGTPILAGAHAWSDDSGLLVYGEWCLRADVEVGYEYQIQR